MPTILANKFYTYSGGNMIVCSECVLRDLKDTEAGKLNDSPVTMNIIDGPVETPAQCDSCLKQSDDYDDVLDEDDG